MRILSIATKGPQATRTGKRPLTVTVGDDVGHHVRLEIDDFDLLDPREFCRQFARTHRDQPLPNGGLSYDFNEITLESWRRHVQSIAHRCEPENFPPPPGGR